MLVAGLSRRYNGEARPARIAGRNSCVVAA
jgi:hypothetical protein